MIDPRFWRFAVVGAGAFVVDATVTLTWSLLLGQPTLARVLGFVVAVTCTYFLNRAVTFKIDDRASMKGWLRYVASQLPATTVNLAVSLAAVNWFGPRPMLIVAAVALGSSAGLIVNFLLARRVFRQI